MFFLDMRECSDGTLVTKWQTKVKNNNIKISKYFNSLKFCCQVLEVSFSGLTRVVYSEFVSKLIMHK